MKICSYHYCDNHNECLFKNATAILKNHPHKTKIGTAVNANIILCYEKEGWTEKNGQPFSTHPIHGGKTKPPVKKINTSDPFIPPHISVVGKNINRGRKPAQPKKKFIPQTLPITIDNFFHSTYGEFKELKEFPDGFHIFFNSKESEYYTNDKQDVLIRISNHWGYDINYCSWHLIGYKKKPAWRWKKKHGNRKRIGIINISDFLINTDFSFLN